MSNFSEYDIFNDSYYDENDFGDEYNSAEDTENENENIQENSQQ
jgi:hypothetical protein